MDEEFTKEVGMRLGFVRRDHGFKQALFSEVLETSLSAYNTYERGQREVPSRIMLQLYKKFEVNLTWLLTGEGMPYVKDPLDLIEAIIEFTNSYLLQEKVDISQEKRKKIISYLFNDAQRNGQFSIENAKQYLESAL